MAASNFPPIDWLWADYWRNAAWYSGDPVRLHHQSRGHGSFWRSDEQIKVHVPIAADISALSASLVFSESPTITVEDEATQQRLDEITAETNLYGLLLRAAELASVYGGVFIKLAWDINDICPRFVIVPADAGLPEWRGSKVWSIRLWSVVREDNNTGAVYRLEELYTNDGHIQSRLLRGTEGDLGSEVPLTTIDETRDIQPDVNSATDMLLAWYVPNMLPNRARPYLSFGRSDYDGLHGLFDELDEAYSAIQRETRFTKTTVIVPAEYLRRKDEIFPALDQQQGASNWTFCNSTGAFTALDIDSRNTTAPITIINPEMRADSRIAVCEDLIRRILSMAGYAPQSAGLDITGNAESGTALTVRERKSLRTTEAKKTYWWHALKDMMRALLKLDAAVFASGIKADAEITVEMPSNTQPDIAQMAEILEQLERAGAISVEGRVQLLHPDWSDDKIADEVRMIRLERGLTGADPLDDMLGDTESTPRDAGDDQ